MRGLTGKRVLITGGASGIGRATVERFVTEGTRVVVFDGNKSACRALAAAVTGLVRVIPVDVTEADALAAAFVDLDAALGGLDVVINNAGISARDPALHADPTAWRRVIDVNLTGIFLVAQMAARRMLPLGGGVIINMGSVSGLVGMPNYAHYNASKAGVIELTRTLALEWAPKLRVIAVCPGYVLTPMQEAEYTPEDMAAVNAKVPLNRHADPSEIAALFAFLASEEAPFITGQPIVIDGGETAGGLASR